MKQCNTEREPRAHNEVLNVVGDDDRHGAPDRVHYLRHAPVQMQQYQAAEGQGQAADTQSGNMPIPKAEGHARGNKGGPYGCEGDEEYPYAIPEGWLCGHVVDGEIIHGGDWA